MRASISRLVPWRDCTTTQPVNKKPPSCQTRGFFESLWVKFPASLLRHYCGVGWAESFGQAQDRLRDTHYSPRWVSALCASTHPTISRSKSDCFDTPLLAAGKPRPRYFNHDKNSAEGALDSPPPGVVIAPCSTKQQEVIMDRNLRELEKAFSAGLVSRRDFFRRAAFLLASTTTAFELLGRLSPRRLAIASTGCITLDLSTTDLASQGYVSDGTEPFSVDTTTQRLTISDNSTTGFRTFTRACPEIPTTSIDVEIILSIDAASVTLQDVDTGVHLVLFEGRGSVGITGRELRAACIFRNSERRLALFTSAGVYSQGVPFNWAAEQVFRLKRLNNGDGMIDLGGGVFEQIAHDDLAVSSLTEPAFRLGCHSANATAVARFGPIGQPTSFPAFLYGSGSNANPPVLFLDDDAPASSTAKYKDSAGIKFGGGNPWRLVGTWMIDPALTSGTLTTLGDLHVWLGLKNSDDAGTRFDLAAEVWKNGALVAEGETLCITGVTRNPNLAKEVSVPFAPFSPVDFDGATDQLSLKILTRIGTNGVGAFCGGHSNAVGLRLYFDSADRPSKFDATFS